MWELELNQQQLSATTACDSGKLLTSIWGVGRGSVEEPRGAWHCLTNGTQILKTTILAYGRVSPISWAVLLLDDITSANIC